ncbi:MAG: transcriptional repressor [Cytophagia bacterium]|nr:transcriptional repressor [Cytophagia bacterium]
MNLGSVEAVFFEYLQERGLRQTPERLCILRRVYAMNGPFTADTLLDDLRNSQNPLSRATVYNTLELLLECRLVAHHQFGRFGSYYEKSHGRRQADHLLCTNCGRIQEFCDPRLHAIMQDAGQALGQRIQHHQLHLHGVCHLFESTGQCPHFESSKADPSSSSQPMH